MPAPKVAKKRKALREIERNQQRTARGSSFLRIAKVLNRRGKYLLKLWGKTRADDAYSQELQCRAKTLFDVADAIEAEANTLRGMR